MKILRLPLVVVAGWVLQSAPPAAAAAADLRSPVTAETYADDQMSWHQLRWLPASHQLVATITFDNIDYVSRVEPRHDETYSFPLPGVKLDVGAGTFYVAGTRGERIPVAQLHGDLIGQSIEFLPTARLLVTNRHGHVTVRLVVDSIPLDGPRWVQR